MKVLIQPRPLTGSITAPTSKSEAHRLLICAALADAPTDVEINSDSEDITATLSCLRALGAKCIQKKNIYHITPITNENVPKYPVLDCNESGSTLRFMLPVTSVLSSRARFTGRGRLPERPIGELQTVMSEHDVSFTRDHLPFDTKGKLSSGEYRIAGNVSSQYVTGLLLALSRLPSPSKIVLTSPLKSAAYVDITLLALKRFGANVRVIKDDKTGTNVIGYEISGIGADATGLKSPDMIPAGADWSSAAFFLTAGALTGPVSVKGLALDSPQGDKNILEQLRDFGAEIHVSDCPENKSQAITVCRVMQRGREVDIDPTPDLLPILAVAAALADGTTAFVNGARLRLKESDRIASTAAMIRSLGGEAIETPDTLIVKGTPLRGGIVNGYHDHRIVMAAAIAASRCSGEVIVTDAEACAKSYPGFFKDYVALGGEVRVL